MVHVGRINIRGTVPINAQGGNESDRGQFQVEKTKPSFSCSRQLTVVRETSK